MPNFSVSGANILKVSAKDGSLIDISVLFTIENEHGLTGAFAFQALRPKTKPATIQNAIEAAKRSKTVAEKVLVFGTATVRGSTITSSVIRPDQLFPAGDIDARIKIGKSNSQHQFDVTLTAATKTPITLTIPFNGDVPKDLVNAERHGVLEFLTEDAKLVSDMFNNLPVSSP